MPRITKLTPETQAKIIAAVRAGNYMETAAAFAGINRDTLYAWLKRGAPGERHTIYTEFSEALHLALAEAEVRDVALIGEAAKTQWQAAAWRLERKYPDRFGRRDRIEHSGELPVDVRGALIHVLADARKREALDSYAAEFGALVARDADDRESGGGGVVGDASGAGRSVEPGPVESLASRPGNGRAPHGAAP